MPALRAIYRAETAEVAELRLADFEAEWGKKYPAIAPAWRRESISIAVCERSKEVVINGV